MEGWDLEGYEKQEKTFYQFEVYNLSFMSQVKSDRKDAQKQLGTSIYSFILSYLYIYLHFFLVLAAAKPKEL
jgi:hypothetical protein